MIITELTRAGAAFLRGASTSPVLDSELLLAAVMKRPREYLIAHGTHVVTKRQEQRHSELLGKRRSGIPFPYLVGTKEFFCRPFLVTPAVMIPRPETEGIVEEILRITSNASLRIADIGTGSGALAVTCALEIPKARIIAVDRTGTALSVARRNARRFHVLRRIMFLESDLLQKIPEELVPEIIIANLPYVTTDHLRHAATHPDTRGLLFEPHRALDGGPDGLYVFRRFFAQLQRFGYVRRHLGHVLLEHSPPQRRALLELAHDTVPEFTPNIVTPHITRWSRRT